jgi:hypothetical protein
LNDSVVESTGAQYTEPPLTLSFPAFPPSRLPPFCRTGDPGMIQEY